MIIIHMYTVVMVVVKTKNIGMHSMALTCDARKRIGIFEAPRCAGDVTVRMHT